MIPVCPTSALPPGEAIRAPAGVAADVAVAVFDVAGAFSAIDDTCTHQDASLADGWLEDCTVRVQFAGSRRDGDVVRVLEGDPAARSFLAVHERDGRPVAVLGMDQPRLVTRLRRQLRSAEPAVP